MKRAPVIIRPDVEVRQGRDVNGRRIKRVWRRDHASGRVAGFEHFHPAGNNDAHVMPATVTVTLSAREFGLTQQQLAAVVERQLRPPCPRRSPAGLILP